MAPELKKTEFQQKSAIESYQVKKDLKQNLFQKNIDQQMQRMNERLKSRRSKSMLAKSRKAQHEKSLLAMTKRTNRPRQNTDQTADAKPQESNRVLEFLEKEVAKKGRKKGLIERAEEAREGGEQRCAADQKKQ